MFTDKPVFRLPEVSLTFVGQNGKIKNKFRFSGGKPMKHLKKLILVLAIVLADQLTKYLTVLHIPLNTGHVDLWPGVVCLTHVHNYGAAFSSFQGAQWLFVIVFIILTAAIVWEFSKDRLPFTNLERWVIAAIYAGGIGNMIDRLRFGFVVDMIEVEFMNFAVFNIADSFITCGCIALLAHLVLFNKDFWKDEKKT